MVSHTRRSTKGTRSKTRKGRKNYTTKKGDKVFHRKGKYVRKSRKPYSKKRGGMRLPLGPFAGMPGRDGSGERKWHGKHGLKNRTHIPGARNLLYGGKHH